MSPWLYVEFSLANVHKDSPKYDHLQYLSLLKIPWFSHFVGTLFIKLTIMNYTIVY